MAVTKHDQILEYIETLPVGERISVRGIAKDLQVSEGTAYRAIKEAENVGLVSTIQRVGTIRIEKKVREHIEKLSFGAVAEIIEGEVIAGSNGLEKILDKFIIGAMTKNSIKRYITPGSLMIVGNREEVQRLALENGAAVLLTGGFDVSHDISRLADTLEMPIIRTSYDTFTVATIINRAMSDQMIKKDIAMVGDIMIPLERTNYLIVKDTVEDYYYLSEETGHTRFPVVNKSNRLLGIVTLKDVTGKSSTQLLEKVMTKNPRQAKKHMSVASIGHLMIWDGIEIIPVVEDDLTLIGIISRQDVMQTLQISQKQPVIANTLADQISAEIYEKEPSDKSELPNFMFNVAPQMVNSMGTLAYGVLNQLIAHVTHRVMMIKHKSNSVIEQSSLYYFKLIQMDSMIDVRPTVIDFGRRSAKLEIDLLIDNVAVAKAVVICQLMEQS
ncbi:DRTGG domain-containing protein [Vagococcus silagei]|uniref:CBS domain-containing protein n=1 Tax=Vagococcus silagei TaxID=2508885 RepID=A0A4S3B7W4_9ENTE|nr:DRTGG domain-containing protein [Vagococcus silagei]THB61816.1 CBS domain-containing protein [Vagococcus silagei]